MTDKSPIHNNTEPWPGRTNEYDVLNTPIRQSHSYKALRHDHRPSHQPVPQTVALFSHLVSPTPLRLKMRGEVFSFSDWTVTWPDGSIPIRLESIGMLKTEIRLVDTWTDKDLMTIGRKYWSWKSPYFARHPTNPNSMLFETVTHRKFLKRSVTAMTFLNAAANGRIDQIEMKGDILDSESKIFHQGKVIARSIEKQFTMHGEFVVHVEPGIDPVLVVILIVVEHNRRQQDRWTYSRW